MSSPSPGSAYDDIGAGYALARREDPLIAAAITDAIGNATSVVNVGAGTGSYEPRDRFVVAVEPSLTMIAQRPQRSARCVQGVAERLPFGDEAFDASMAVCTVNHWDWARGLREMRRVAKRVVLFDCFERELLETFWLIEYFPDILRFPTEAGMATLDGVRDIVGHLAVVAVPLPHNCTDGFLGAHWRRPESYLEPVVRQGISCFHRLPDADLGDGLRALGADLASGRWAERFGDLLGRDSLDLGFRIVVSVE